MWQMFWSTNSFGGIFCYISEKNKQEQHWVMLSKSIQLLKQLLKKQEKKSYSEDLQKF